MKKAAFSLSVSAIVILILAIVMLGLGITFIKNMFGKASGQFEELISNEPEPQTPTINYPITLSRDYIISNSGETEVIKVGIFNPMHFDWIATYFSLGTSTHCKSHDDGVCYVRSVGACKTLNDDNDCTKIDDDHCSVYDGICYYNENDLSCGHWNQTSFYTHDLNCGYPGVFPLLNCTDLNLWSKTYQALPKNIKSSSSETLNVIFEVPKAPKGTYLCKAEIWPYTRYVTDFTIRID